MRRRSGVRQRRNYERRGGTPRRLLGIPMKAAALESGDEAPVPRRLRFTLVSGLRATRGAIVSGGESDIKVPRVAINDHDITTSLLRDNAEDDEGDISVPPRHGAHTSSFQQRPTRHADVIIG